MSMSEEIDFEECEAIAVVILDGEVSTDPQEQDLARAFLSHCETVAKLERDVEKYLKAWQAEKADANEMANSLTEKVAKIAGLLKALKGLFGASQNEMVARGLPLEWRSETAMGQAEAAIAKAEGRS